jgi:MFS family permease
LFSARFYYPVFTILFLDYGLTLEQFALLNLVWALTIVVAEVPSGALADLIGRKRLIVAAAGLMVVEMLLLVVVPLGASAVLFWVFVLNRICSGLAEAAASGADEALAYDSLTQLGEEGEWAKWLEWTARAVSVGFFCTMILGALSYDVAVVNGLLQRLHPQWVLPPELIIRIPVILTLITACIALVVSVGMVEVHSGGKEIASAEWRQRLIAPFRQIIEVFRWMAGRRFIWLVILAALVLDSVPRQLIILASEYYRLIGIPTAWFGFIGAGLSLLGIVTAALSRRMVTHCQPLTNFLFLSAVLMTGLIGVSMTLPWWGILFAVMSFSLLAMVNYQSSYYLNREADARHRATLLSFRGLALNLALGMASLCYTFWIILIKTRMAADTQLEVTQDAVFAASLKAFPPYFAVLFMLVLLAGWLSRRQSAQGCTKPD